MKKYKAKQSGIGLIEVLISTALLSTVMLWITDGHMKSLSHVTDGANSSTVMRLAEEMLERIKLNLSPQLYKTEINGVNNRDTYCQTIQNCTGNKCVQSELVKYDVQQTYCHDLDGISNLKMRFECFDVHTGSALTNCAQRSILRGRVSITWDSKGGKSGELSTDADALLRVNQALSFDGGNGYLKVSGAGTPSARGDFTIAMWVKPKNLADADFFGAPGDGNRRSIGLSVKADGGVRVDSYGKTVTHHSEEYCVARAVFCWDWETRRWTTTNYVSYNRTINNFFSPETWVHITWIRKANNYFLYKNGALVQRWAVTKSLDVKNYFFIGRVNNYFNGEIDDVQVYSAAILKSQVRVVMRGQVVAQPLAVHITFDGSSFNDAKKDRSKNNRTVSAHGGVNENSLTHAVR